MTDIPKHVLEAAREAYYGRHEHGWICTPLIGEVDTPPVLRIAHAILAARARRSDPSIPEGRLFETAEMLAAIEHNDGYVEGCSYEPIFRGSVDLLDARDAISALLAARAAQAERMARLEEALRPFADALEGYEAGAKLLEIPELEDEFEGTWDIRIGYLRRARALSQEGSEPS